MSTTTCFHGRKKKENDQHFSFEKKPPDQHYLQPKKIDISIFVSLQQHVLVLINVLLKLFLFHHKLY